MTSTKDIYWLAGLLEGEGCFTSTGIKGMPSVALKMNDRDVVRQAGKILCASRVRSYADKTRLGESPYFAVSISGCRAAGWMMTIYPLMGQRRQDRIRSLLRDWKGRKGRQNGGAYNAPRPTNTYLN